MAQRRMFFRLPTEGAADVFESEFGPIEYIIVECEPGDAPPDGYVTDHTAVYTNAPVAAPKRRGRPPKVNDEAPDEGEGE